MIQEGIRTGERVRLDCNRIATAASAKLKPEWPFGALYPLLRQRAGILRSLPPGREKIQKYFRYGDACLCQREKTGEKLSR